MKINIFYIFLVPFLFVFAINCSKNENLPQYPNNAKPLLKNQFIKLPLGAVKPANWLKDQLTAQAEGLTGHLEDFWPDLMNSAWKGGEGESWERGPYYLDGLIPLAYLLEDEKLLAKSRVWLEWILNSSRANGWFGPEKNEDRWPLAVAMKVVRQYYEVSKDTRALELLKEYFRYLNENPPDWPDDTWRGVRAMEHAVTGYWLFRQTGDIKILATIQSIFENSFSWTDYFYEFPWDSAAVADKKIPHNWKADGLTAHVVNVAMSVKYPGLWYQQSGDEIHRQAVYTALENLDKHHGQAAGRFSGDEHLSGKSPLQGTEMCAVVEFMFSLEKLFEIFGDPKFADRLELLAYNALPGTMTPDCRAHQYNQQANQVLVSDAERNWSTNGPTSNVYGLMPNYPCCLANMHQAWPKFVQHMWMASNDGGLAAVAYGPNVVWAKVAGGRVVKIIQTTDYPFAESIQFKIELETPAKFPLYFRIPGWAKDAKITINDAEEKLTAKQIQRIVREWKNGDVISLNLPMEIRTERRFNNSVSILRGPLYYSLRIDKKYKKIKLKSRSITSIDYSGTTDWQIEPTTNWNYALLIDEKNLAERFLIKNNLIRKFPFADKGELIYSDKENKYLPWPHDAPVVIKAKGKTVPDWRIKNNSADAPPQSPVTSPEAVEELSLVPYGCARLRITEFPVIEN